MYILVGLGNPGEEYDDTRHNTGRSVLEAVRKKYDFSQWIADKKLKAQSAKGKIGKEMVTLIMPDTFMNKSGSAVTPLIKNEKQALRLIIVHDDLDLALGKFKISFNRGAGGHRGVESIIRAIKTEKFIRIRIGISPANSKGVVKKPKGEEAVGNFILGKFKKPEAEALKKVSKKVSGAVEMIIGEGVERAMGEYNSL